LSGQWTIDGELLKRIVEVARLELTDEELEVFTGQLRVILDAFKKLDEVDTSGVEPSFHPKELKNVLRDDDAEPWSWDPLENTSHKKGRYFKGPRIQ
jgi:aspartyl-tRNA(Asn)/glutamyl-tRNA(Gln) amidotransferase subunit C